MKDGMFVHTVHTNFLISTPYEKIRDTVESFKELRNALAEDKGVLFFKVALNSRRSRRLDPKKKHLKRVQMVQVAIFKNTEAYDRFLKHPIHVAIKEKLKYIGDWEPGDIDLGDEDFAMLMSHYGIK